MPTEGRIQKYTSFAHTPRNRVRARVIMGSAGNGFLGVSLLSLSSSGGEEFLGCCAEANQLRMRRKERKMLVVCHSMEVVSMKSRYAYGKKKRRKRNDSAYEMRRAIFFSKYAWMTRKTKPSRRCESGLLQKR